MKERAGTPPKGSLGVGEARREIYEWRRCSVASPAGTCGRLSGQAVGDRGLFLRRRKRVGGGFVGPIYTEWCGWKEMRAARTELMSVRGENGLQVGSGEDTVEPRFDACYVSGFDALAN